MLTTARIVVLGVMALASIGGTGVGVYRSVAQDGVPKPAPGEKIPVKAVPPDSAAADALRAKLAARPDGVPEAMTFASFIRHMQGTYDITICLDLPAMARFGMIFPDDYKVYDQKVTLAAPVYASVGDMIQEVLPQISQWAWKLPRSESHAAVNTLTYRVVGGHVRIGPAYGLLTITREQQVDDQDEICRLRDAIKEQRYGPVVSVSFNKATLAQAVETLRAKTGANIMVDPRVAEAAAKSAPPVTASFDDVRLLTVLELVAAAQPADGDRAIKPVSVGNVFYVTYAPAAEAMQKQADLAVYGPREPAPAPPAPSGACGGCVPPAGPVAPAKP